MRRGCQTRTRSLRSDEMTCFCFVLETFECFKGFGGSLIL
ncbi:hypothetical protein DCAR_0100858 [Daucus carota subsp. sativus]|uniref:Uncharacterized protein n=1 Tax=Daucus carota subsp. sativus TaxID=79200 RepID=A0AAF1AII8_DAUCS|nr:hypothetical protein DCAR_0100858 [Daucus carota subsp. sativus]